MIFLPMYSPEGEVSDIMGIMDAGHISDSVEMLEELLRIKVRGRYLSFMYLPL